MVSSSIESGVVVTNLRLLRTEGMYFTKLRINYGDGTQDDYVVFYNASVPISAWVRALGPCWQPMAPALPRRGQPRSSVWVRALGCEFGIILFKNCIFN